MRTGWIVLVLALCSAACEDDLLVPNYNAPSVQDLTSNPNRAAIAAAAQGMLAGQRGLTNVLVVTLGIFGREGYNLRPEEPRTVTNNLINPIVGSGAYWDGPYAQIRNGFVLLAAVDRSNLSDAEKEGVRGFVKTLMAEAYFHVIMTRRDFGAPLDIDRDPTGELAPIASEEQVYERIFQLFDEGKDHLLRAGGAFPFRLTSGFAGFSTPQAFIKVNRALKARVLKYRGRWAEALQALGESFLDPNGPLDLGVYHTYSTRSGDQTNDLAAAAGIYLFAHPRLLTQAQRRPDGGPDLRAERKLARVPAFTFAGITVTEKFTIYGSLSSPLPWIRNEELILIRAEAARGMGDRAAALADVNRIRQRAGGLAPLPADPGEPGLLDEILYNRLYSLVWEGGFAWLDAVQYGRLQNLPKALPNHVRYDRFPFPTNECLARKMESAPACQPVVGF